MPKKKIVAFQTEVYVNKIKYKVHKKTFITAALPWFTVQV